MLSAKQQPSNIKHGGAIRPNVCKLTFGPPCRNNKSRFICFFNTFTFGTIISKVSPLRHMSYFSNSTWFFQLIEFTVCRKSSQSFASSI